MTKPVSARQNVRRPNPIIPLIPPMVPWRCLVALLVMAAVLVSWEPGADVRGHVDLPGTGQIWETAHESFPENPGFPSDLSGKGNPSDFHYHSFFDFSSETCTDEHPKPFRAFLSPFDRFVNDNEKLPEAPFIDPVPPPLI